MQFADDDLLIEITVLGDWQRVAVLHVGSGAEAVVRGPLSASTEWLVASARRQLERRLQRRPPPPPPGLWA